MTGGLFSKSVRDLRGATLGWGVGLALYAVLMVAFYPTVEGQPELQAYWDSLPDGLKALFGGDQGTFLSFEGFLNVEFFVIAPILLSVLAIMRGTATIAGEEEAGTMDLLMSQPIDRKRVVLTKYGTLALALLVVFLLIGLALVAATVAVGIDAGLGGLYAASLVGLPLVLVVASVAVLGSCAFRRRRTAVLAATVFTVASYLWNGLAPLVDVLAPWRRASVFYLYGQSRPMSTGIDWAANAILLGLAVGFLLLAVYAFERKDLQT